MPVHFSTLRLAVLVGEEIYDLKIESITQLARGERKRTEGDTQYGTARKRAQRWRVVDKEEEEDTEKEQKRE